MRIGTQNFYDRSLFSLQTRQSNLDRAQEELSTGKKILRTSDDPVASNTIIKLKSEISVSDRYVNAQGTASRFNEVEESNLSSMNVIMLRVQELLVQAGNGSLDSVSLNAIGIELDKRADELFALSNSKNSNGDYLYSGFQTNTIPYKEDKFGYAQYQGDSGQREVLVAASYKVEVNDPGNSFIDNVSSPYGHFLNTAGGGNTGTLDLSVGLVSDSTEFTQPTAPASAYQVVFSGTAPAPATSYHVIDVQTGITVTPSRNFTPGDDIQVQGISIKTDASTRAEVNDTFSITAAPGNTEKSLHWVLKQAIETMKVTGNNYTAMPNPTSTVGISGGNIIKPDEHTLADFDIILTPGAPDTVQVNEVDRSTIPVTVLSTPVPAQTYNPTGTKLEFNGIELDLAGPAPAAADTIRLDRPESSRRGQLLGDLQQDLKNAFTNVDNIRSQVGARLNTIDNEANAQFKFKEVSVTALANLEEVDIYAAMQTFQSSMTGLQASQQAFAKVQELSLFNFI
jgi:flagellar hook-associated protein 3